MKMSLRSEVKPINNVSCKNKRVVTCQDVMLIHKEFRAIFMSEISNVSHSEGVKIVGNVFMQITSPINIAFPRRVGACYLHKYFI